MTRNLTAALALLSACSAAPAGNWTGDLDCGPDTVPIAMDLFLMEGTNPDQLTGDGSIDWTDSEGGYWRIDFGAFVQVGKGDPAPLAVLLEECEEIDLGPMVCSNVTGIWDKQMNALVGEVEDFLDAGQDCDFNLIAW